MMRSMQILSGGCKFLRRAFPVMGVGLIAATISVQAAPAPVTSTEAAAFGQQLARHFNQNDRAYYLRAFDVDAVLAKAVPQMQGDEQMADFERGLRMGLGAQLRAPKSLRFLETTQMDGQCCVLMRMILTNNSVSYQSLYLEHDATNGIKISDDYIFITAERLSDTMRRVAIPFLQSKKESVLDRMFGDTPDLVKYASQWESMASLMQHGQYQEALDTYAQLPDSLKREKFLLVQRLQAAQRVSDKEYLDTITYWRQTYPDDPALDLMAIDYYTLLKQYDKALECIDRVDKAIGGDPWMEFQRGVMYSLKNDEPNAVKHTKHAFEQEPDLVITGLFTVLLMEQSGEYAAAVNMLEEMHEKGKYPVTGLDRGLRGNPKFAALVQSDEYKKWFYAVSPDGIPAAAPASQAN